MNWEGSGHDCHTICREGLRERNPSVSKACIRAEIRTRDLGHTKQGALATGPRFGVQWRVSDIWKQ